jgi:Asp/Glu/hydantoin racemase
MSQGRRITLIHATPVAIQPIQDAFAAGWPEAIVTNVMDDGLTNAGSLNGELSSATKERFCDLARYAYKNGAEAILFTCSAFGPAIEDAASMLPIPVLKPNEAMFEEAMARGSHIGMLVTFAPAAQTMEAEFRRDAERVGSLTRVKTVLVQGAMDALRAGDEASHNRLIVAQADDFDGFDAIMLAHFSTSRAARALSEAVPIPILTSPGSAVSKLRRLLAAS